jgi:hypothetical protein
MNNGRLTLALAILLGALLPISSAQAAGPYIGGGITASMLQDEDGTPGGTDFDESDTGYKLFGGYRFDWLPIVSLSAELGYRNLGTPAGSLAEYEIDGFDYAALAGLGLGPVEVFGRLGGMRYDLVKGSGGVLSTFDGNAPVYGVGLRFALLGLGVRAEYEMIDIDEMDRVDMVSLSVLYEF